MDKTTNPNLIPCVNKTRQAQLAFDTDFWQQNLDLHQDISWMISKSFAEQHSISELELWLCHPNRIYLGSNCRDILSTLDQLGRVKNSVSNHTTIHSKYAKFADLKLGERMGLALNPDYQHGQAFDVRLFLDHYQHALAISSSTPTNHPVCLIFFDAYGQRINQLIPTNPDQQALDFWQTTIHIHAANADLPITLTVAQTKTPWQPYLLSEQAKQDFHQDWLSMTDIHQFQQILSRHHLDRANGYHQAPPQLAHPLQPTALMPLFEQLVSEHIPVMIFSGNRGMVQIQTGPITHLQTHKNYVRLGNDHLGQFTLHIAQDAIAQLWWVKRPSAPGGYIISLEAFDIYGESMFSIFGLRAEHTKQDHRWQAISYDLVKQYAINHSTI